MNFRIPWKGVIACSIVVLGVLIVASLFDIVIAVLNPRFYSTAAFIVIFGVAGIFAGVIGYMQGIEKANPKNETARWTLIILLIGFGLLFFFLLARIEGGEYEAAFKSYGITTALSSLLFMKGKIN
ncbi:MAG: hypothetical protein SGI83_06130 [Bacteroidota bacterium]|nr:hypothetical protein [Bacteroidota bacterium]